MLHGPLHLVVDSTGLKLFGRGEWQAEKTRSSAALLAQITHRPRRRDRRDRRPHLDRQGYRRCRAVAVLLEQVDSEIASVTADGAYDGEPSYEVVAARQADPPPDVVIPPRATAAPSKTASDSPTRRDRHIQLIREKGRMGWQKATGYGRRNLVETGIGRYKGLIGTKLRARTPVNQQGEAAIAVELLNRMIETAKPVSIRVR